MKKYLNPDLLPLVVLGCGMIGMLLRLWQYLGGVTENGLLIPGHISGILLLILSVLVILLILVFTLSLRQGSKYRYNFPVSTPGCVGAGVAAIGVLITAFWDLARNPDGITTIAGVLGLMAAGSLCVLSRCRLRGQQPNMLYHICVTVYLMLRLICQYRIWSGDPQIINYCWPLLASVCVALSCYQSAAFDGELGNRRPHAFFHLAALYFCCLSLIGEHDPGFYLTLAVWMFTDICRLTPMPRIFSREEQA